MTNRKSLICMLGAIISGAGPGCIVVGTGGWSVGCSGPRVWTAPTTERITVDPAGLASVDVRTHNGTITFEGQAAGSPEAFVTVTTKAGGRTMEDAEAALDAIEIIAERTGDDTQRLGWKWRGMKRSTWSAKVSFDIKAPAEVNLDAETHNGAVTITGAMGDVSLETHNGRVNVDAGGSALHAETHNGKVVASFSGSDITLLTHNGGISADLHQCGAVTGSITTHNGAVEVVVGDDMSTKLTCQTNNGSINSSASMETMKVSRRKFTGVLGSGDGKLSVTTHNGSVRIKKASG